MKKNKMCFWLLSWLVFCLPMQGNTVELIVNGGFETGDFTGWTVMEQAGSSGSWFVYSGTTTPLSGSTVLPPPQGDFAAITDSINEGSKILYQDVFLPPGTNPMLSLIYYYNIAGEATFHPQPSLDFNFGNHNEQARIDIMNPAADPFSVAPGDVFANLFQTLQTSPTTQGYTTLTFDLTPFAGQTIRLRFAEVETNAPINFAVDAVSIMIANPIPIPPSNLTARLIKNKFVTQTDCIHRLKWSPSLDPTVTSYLIFRNGKFIATVPANGRLAYDYDDHNRCGKIDTYGVAAFNGTEQSTQITATVK